MQITLRQYNHAEDYALVDEFLIEHYRPGNQDRNWVEPAWEYMHHHGLLNRDCLGRFGIWEGNGEIVAVAHYEWRLGEAFFQFHPAYRHLRRDMLDYVETNLVGRSEDDGQKVVWAYVNDYDEALRSLVQERGFTRKPEMDRPMASFDIPDPFPPITLPDGFRLTSLADDCDWAKVHRVLWRGFDHEGDPPTTQEELEDRRRMFDTPKARRDLKIAVEASDGSFVAFCGMFYEPTNRYAYVEPVATDPDYRRRGLGRAAVLEGIRRCGELGAAVAYVGTAMPFYLSLGFRQIYNRSFWARAWAP